MPPTDMPHTGAGDVTDRLREHLARGDGSALAEWIDTLAPGEIVRAMTLLSADEQGRLLHVLDPEDAAESSSTFVALSCIPSATWV